jgi:hypothetical protein
MFSFSLDRQPQHFGRRFYQGGQTVRGTYCSIYTVATGVRFWPTPGKPWAIVRQRIGQKRYIVLPFDASDVYSLAMLNPDVPVYGPFRTWEEALVQWSMV